EPRISRSPLLCFRDSVGTAPARGFSCRWLHSKVLCAAGQRSGASVRYGRDAYGAGFFRIPGHQAPDRRPCQTNRPPSTNGTTAAANLQGISNWPSVAGYVARREDTPEDCFGALLRGVESYSDGI